jgi:putative endonuclease
MRGSASRYGRAVVAQPDTGVISHDDASIAARRERAMKRWRRDWKIELVEQHNPTWRDLFGDVLRDHGFEW